jgi:hypothetical protein
MGNRNSGRRPQPTALKVLRGNPGQRRLNDAEPQPKGEVVKPAMSEAAGVVWDRVAPVALAMGTLTAADVDAFKSFCELQAALDANTDVDRLMKLTASVRPYYGMFGLEPSGRTKIKVPKTEPTSKWAAIGL